MKEESFESLMKDVRDKPYQSGCRAAVNQRGEFLMGYSVDLQYRYNNEMEL